MSLKITIEVDGHSEQQLAPALNRLAHQQSGRPASFFHENSALLQQQVQQLTKQNRLLQAQLSSHSSNHSSQALAGAVSKALLPASNNPDRPVSVQVMPPAPTGERPRLPAQYQTSYAQQFMHRVRRIATATSQRLWQGLVWIAFGREWLAVVLLLGSGLYGVFQIAPVISQRLPALRPAAEEAASETGEKRTGEERPDEEGPGQTVSPAETSSDTTEQAVDTNDDTGLPIPAAIGDHPAPPPAFQDNSIDYQPR